MKAFHFLAFDIGATSGRAVLGSLQEGSFTMREIHRFPTPMVALHGHYYWDVFNLYSALLEGLSKCAAEHIPLCSIGIDTWGVDFGYLANDGTLLGMPRAYRDPYTEGAPEDFFKHLPKREVYARTGIQVLPFNSLFQLFRTYEDMYVPQEIAERILFIPDLLTYMLTEQQVCEYTIASTSQILDPKTKQLDAKLLQSVGLSAGNFGPMVNPATEIGTITEEVQRMTGLGAVPVIAVAGHDTGSAVAAVPAKNEKFAYLSSGTWSLMGIETCDAIINEVSYDRNFTNEGGIEGTTRFLKNICGMWLYERCRKEWTDAPKSHAELQAEAMKQPAFQSIINPDDAMFANPSSMVEAIQTYCRNTNQHVPEGYAEICRCIFDSLALRYRQVFGYLKEMASFPIEVLHIIGGGSLNNYLNQFTANSLGVEVLAGPQEGTALGNIMLQAKASGQVKDIWDMRRIIANSLELKHFAPQDKEVWDAAYEKFVAICGE